MASETCRECDAEVRCGECGAEEPGYRAAVPDPATGALLHELWLRVHVRRFDGNDYPEGRPTYVSEQRAVDCFYAGVMKSQHIIEDLAREHGIDRVYDVPTARAAAPDALKVAVEALAAEVDHQGGVVRTNWVLGRLRALLDA